MHEIFEINEKEVELEWESINIDTNNELPGSEGNETDSELDTTSTNSSSGSKEPTWRADIPNDGGDPRYEHIDRETANDEVWPTLGNVLQMEYNEERERLSKSQIAP